MRDMGEISAQGDGGRGGQPAAMGQTFGLVYDEHVKAIYAYCYARLGNRPDAEDATEQTFFQAWNAFARYREQGAPVKAWLFRIASNVVIDTYRRRSFRLEGRLGAPLEAAETLADPSPQPPEVAEARELYGDLQRAIQTLPVDYQQVLALRFSQDLKVTEIAEVMGRSEGSVKMLLHRAVGALRTRLQPGVLDGRGGAL